LGRSNRERVQKGRRGETESIENMSTGLNIYDICHLNVRDILRLDGNARNRKNRKGSKEIHQPRTPGDPKPISWTPVALVRKMVSVDQCDRTNWQALRLWTINRKSVG